MDTVDVEFGPPGPFKIVYSLRLTVSRSGDAVDVVPPIPVEVIVIQSAIISD